MNQLLSNPQFSYVQIYAQASGTTGNQVLYAQRFASDQTKIGDPIQVTLDQINSQSVSTLVLQGAAFEVTYRYTDPTDLPNQLGERPIYLSTVEISAAGIVVGGSTLGASEITSDRTAVSVSLDHMIALKGGGYAYIATNENDNYQEETRTAVFGYVGPNGKVIQSALTSFTSSDGPEPVQDYSEPVLQQSSNGTFLVRYTTFFDQLDPGYPAPSDITSYTSIYAPDGTLQSRTTSYSSGSEFIEVYDPEGHRTSTVAKPGDGSTNIDTYDVSTGRLIDNFVRQKDGSRTETNYQVIGKDYAEQTASYDNMGKLLSMTRNYASGTVAFIQVNNSDGTGTVANYDTNARLTTSIAFAADGSRDATLRTYVGASLSPSTVEVDHFGTDGKKASSNLELADGSHLQTAAVTGVTLTSTPGVADTFRAAGAGRDTFVFAPGFGQDLITNFHAGSNLGHDIADFTAFKVVLGSNQSQADYLAQHLTQAGRDAVLTITPNDVLTLKNTQIASLTTADVKI